MTLDLGQLLAQISPAGSHACTSTQKLSMHTRTVALTASAAWCPCIHGLLFSHMPFGSRTVLLLQYKTHRSIWPL